MNIPKKKKGSTFLIVIIVMAIIFTTGTAILAVSASDYKMRINQSEKIENLYRADSGIDIVENIIITTSKQAIKYADKKVKEEFSNLDEENRNSEKVNELFKEKFYEFLTVDNKQMIDSQELEILQYLILKKEYIKSISENGELEFELAVDSDEDSFTIEIPENEYGIGEEGIYIKVNSTFESSEGEFKNKKIISTKFTITAPEYNSDIETINIYPVFDNKAITADGNMEISTSNLNINGDIWIKGKNDLEENPEYTFDKYIGGIKLDNSNFSINGNIYTANTFHLSNEVSEALVNGDIYAKNIYVGKSINSIASNLNNISFEKDVIVNNDLALNAINSSILIKNNFYGINEKTTEVSTANKALNSSSIIVNDISNTSTLTVNNNSYIMGVAYLNAEDKGGKKYQTGESVAVKGNYLAYTDAEDILDGKENISLKYYSPLQLLESIDGDSSAKMKADYFAKYYSKAYSHYQFNDGGVNLKGIVKSVGTSIKDSNGNIKKSNIDGEDLKLINKIRDEFGRNVFAMGDATGYENLYSDQTVKATVSNQIDFNKISSIQNKDFDTSEGVVILKGDSSDIVIENKRYEGESLEKGLIITNGNIIIKGDFYFTGNIITTGDVIISGNGEKNITYDAQVIRDILASNSDPDSDSLEDIFIKAEGNREEIKITSSSELYNEDNFLTKSLWKIIK